MLKTLPSRQDAKVLFNPHKTREHLDAIYGVPLHRSRNIEEVAEINALGSHASSMISSAIRCILVGYDDVGHELLAKSKLWAEEAIKKDEPQAQDIPPGEDFIIHEELALCNWLLSGKHDEENSRAGVRNSSLYYSGCKKDKVSIALAISAYIDAFAYEATLELIESTPGLKQPSSAKRVSGPAGMSYIIAAHHVRDEYSADEVQAALQKFLQRKMCEWVHGHYSTLARWLKIAYFNESETPLTPKETLLKAYDYLLDAEYPGDV